MPAADNSLKRTASPEAEEAEPNKRQKQDGQNDVPSTAPQTGESAAEAAATAYGEGVQIEEARPEQDESQQNNDVSDELPDLEGSVAGVSTGAHTEESHADSDTHSSTGPGVNASAEAREKAKKEQSEWTKTVNTFITHGNNTGFFSEDLRKKGHNSRPPMPPHERRRLMEDLAGQSNTSEPQDQGIEGDGLQPKVGLDFMSEFSTAVDSPKDAAAFLGIDLQSPRISPQSALRLRIDQVQNIAFMVKKAEGILQGCVNANEYGTGKTIEALASVFFLARRREACLGFGKHKAAFILCPHQAFRGWQEAHAKYFSGLLTLRICSRSLPAGEHSQLIDLTSESPDPQSESPDPQSQSPDPPRRKSAFEKFLDTLSPSDPQTSYTVIISTYSELSSKEFLVERKQEDVREKELSLRGSKLNDEALEALKVAQKPVLFDLSFNPEIIGTLVADEAHEIKDPRSGKSQAAYLLDADIHFLLTARPVDNKVSDFRGLLFALYKPKDWQINWPLFASLKGFLKMFDDDFDPFKIKHSKNLIPHDASPEYIQALRNGQHLWRLNPHAYRFLAHHMRFGPELSRRILGSIYRLCLLRRGVVSVATMPTGGATTISGILALPPVSIRTIEVSMGDGEKDYKDLADTGFNRIFQAGGKKSGAGAARVINGNETPLAAFNNCWDTFLSHITADLGLADIQRKLKPTEEPASRSSLPDIDDLIRNNTDAGMSFYYSMTRHETDPVQPPSDRMSMIRHLVRRSPKLRWLLVKLEELKQRREKVIVYFVHPLTQWLVEGVCSMAEFNFLSLRSKPKHDDETRTTVIDSFNDPAKRHDFLLSTFRILGHGVDLHADCHNIIIFELPDNVPDMLSAVGRVRRVGQTKPQEVTILMMKDSYDDYTLHRQSQKYAISILAFGVLGERLDRLALRVEDAINLRRSIYKRRVRKDFWLRFLRSLKRDWPILEVVKLLGAGELLRRHLGAQYNRRYIPWHCRHRILFGFRGMKLADFAGANMGFNTVTGRLIVKLAAQLPATGPKSAGVGSLPTRLKD